MAPKNKGQQPPPDDDEEEGGFSEKQLGQLNALIGNTVNATVTAQLQRKLDSAVRSQLEPAIGEIRDLIGGLKPQGSGAGGTGGEQPKQPPAGNAGAGTETHPEVLQMKQRLAAIEAERKTERDQARREKRDATLMQLATAAGVDKHRVRGAVKLLADQVVIDEKTGAMTMKVSRNGFDEDVELSEGSAEFFKSDEGKAYLAPTQQQRGGNAGPNRSSAANVVRGGMGGGSSSGTNNAPARDPKQAKAERKAQALEQLSEGIGQLLDGGNVDIG